MKTYIIVIAFLLGFLFCSTYKSSDLIENFKGEVNKNDCPNKLIRKGNVLHLLNTKKPNIPGVNPIIFKNLEEYVEYIKYKRSQGIHCPILYYQETYNTQGQKGLRLLPDPLEPNAGLPSNTRNMNAIQRALDDLPETDNEMLLLDANRDDPPYNQNQYSGFDANDQYIGVKTPLDKIDSRNNPMSKNWGGHQVTVDAVKSGQYKGRTRGPPK